MKLHTVFGGKNPHPNYLVGGVPCAINMDGDMSAGAPLNTERLFFVKQRIDEMKAFNDNVYVPDVLAIASFYKKQLWGGGLGAKSVMDYGAYPLTNYDKSTDQLPGGVILDDNWDNVMEIDPRDPEQVQEFVNHSWYKYPDESKGLHPWDGITEPNYDVSTAKGTRTNIEEIDENAKYSWIKAPRWRGHAVEVGPLSRYTLAYAQGNEYVQEQIHSSVAAFNTLAGTNLGAKPILQSTIGRTLARALESQYCSDMMVDDWHRLIQNIKNGDTVTANMEKWDPSTWPKECKGVGTAAAPRGGLGHWIRIKDGKIENYQCVVPTTWNGSPRDPAGNIGAFEACLMGTPVERPDEPVEILRNLHSFDPCLACSTHVMSEEGEEIVSAKVR